MIMKRLVVLIALASTAALSQQRPGDGNIPAPDLFDNQILCLGQLPSMAPTPSTSTGEMESHLDTLIEAGEIPEDDELLYIIPATAPDCGGGRAGDSNFDGVDDNDFSVADGGAYDVAKLYTEAYDAFEEVADAEVVVNDRQQRLNDLRSAATETNPNTTAIENAEESLERAQTTLQQAQATLDAIGSGPIIQAGIAEWRASRAVERARLAWNSAVSEVANSQSELDRARYANYVDLIDKRVNNIVNTDGTINFLNLRTYISATDFGVDPNDNFDDDTGALVVPTHDHDSDSDTPRVPITNSATVGAIRSQVEAVNEAVKALVEAEAANENPLRSEIFEEGVRRAKLEQAHWQEQLEDALDDDTDLDTSSPGEQSIRALNAEHREALDSRNSAETVLRDAVEAREAGTQGVIDEFHNPNSFYEQLVERRRNLKDEADDAVASAVGDPTKAQVNAAVAAAEALEEAKEMQAKYLALVDDPEDPIIDLVDTMLETDGDDGRAVVDAISKTYGETVENRDSIAGLTADTEDGADEDGPVTANRKAIAGNADDIESLDGRVTQNETDIDALQEDTEMNAGMIATNAGNIASNASNIAVNANNIVDNRSYIGRNAATLVEHGAFIERNAGHIAMNSERIGANAAAITMNSGLISDNRHMIGELSSELDVVRAGVAASIALSRMPSVEGGGISFGAGTYAGEMAYAVGFQVERGFGTFDIGVTSSGGEIGAGVGVGLKVWH